MILRMLELYDMTVTATQYYATLMFNLESLPQLLIYRTISRRHQYSSQVRNIRDSQTWIHFLYYKEQ